MLAVGVSTVESVTVTGVTYGGQPLTSRIARAAHGTRAEIWTLTAPATGSGTVQVTLSGDATATVGASLFTGVDQADPVMAANAGDADTGATSAVAVLNGTTAIDGMLGVLALGNVENTYNVRAGGSTDLVTSDVRWNEVGSVRAAGATRSGNTGQNMALTAGVNWRWNRIDPAQKNPYTLAVVGLRAGAVNTVPSAAAGGPYTTTEGNGVTLDASGSSDADGDTLSYEWDVDGDGYYDDATGVNPTVSAATLAAIGLGDGPDSASVRVRVSDAEATTTSNATTLTITNAAPSAQLHELGRRRRGRGRERLVLRPGRPLGRRLHRRPALRLRLRRAVRRRRPELRRRRDVGHGRGPRGAAGRRAEDRARQRQGLRQGRRHAQLRDHDRGHQRGAVRDPR